MSAPGRHEPAQLQRRAGGGAPEQQRAGAVAEAHVVDQNCANGSGLPLPPLLTVNNTSSIAHCLSFSAPRAEDDGQKVGLIRKLPLRPVSVHCRARGVGLSHQQQIHLRRVFFCHLFFLKWVWKVVPEDGGTFPHLRRARRTRGHLRGEAGRRTPVLLLVLVRILGALV